MLTTETANRERLRGPDDELSDPYRQGPQAFEKMADEADAAIAAIVEIASLLR
ncbi:MAG: hypothetical protein LCH60_09100 [Actinobacteria bacterium]|nr:hypothetical protein [Actinomycetota bacterium]